MKAAYLYHDNHFSYFDSTGLQIHTHTASSLDSALTVVTVQRLQRQCRVTLPSKTLSARTRIGDSDSLTTTLGRRTSLWTQDLSKRRRSILGSIWKSFISNFALGARPTAGRPFPLQRSRLKYCFRRIRGYNAGKNMTRDCGFNMVSRGPVVSRGCQRTDRCCVGRRKSWPSR